MKKVFIGSLILISSLIIGCSSSETPQTQNNVEEQTTNTEVTEDTNKEIKHGTSDYVDAIYYHVKETAGMTLKVNEAWEWTKENYLKCNENQETMEKAMFYGYILEKYGTDDVIKKVGQDLVQAVKYVYRGASTVDSEDTKINLEQIKKGIDKATKQ